MRRIVVVMVVAALVAGAFTTVADAAKKTKPVVTKLYAHGNYPIGDWMEFVGSISDDTHMMMDAQEPEGGAPKSMSFSLPVGNPECTGNPLFPSWEGQVTGTILNKVTLHGHFASAPATAIARLWVDIPFSSCTSETAGVDNFKPPVAEVEVEVPAGHSELEIVFDGLGKLKVKSNMILELHQNGAANQGRVLYDSADLATHVMFKCIPTAGKACA